MRLKCVSLVRRKYLNVELSQGFVWFFNVEFATGESVGWELLCAVSP